MDTQSRDCVNCAYVRKESVGGCVHGVGSNNQVYRMLCARYRIKLATSKYIVL